MRKTSIGLRFLLPCFAVNTTRLRTMAFLEMKLYLDERSVGGPCRLNNPRPCKDASLFLDEIHTAEKTVSKLIDKHQADWLWVQNQGRKNPHNFEVDDRVWLHKSETTLDGDDKLLPLWEGPFAVTARLGENRWRMHVDVNREIEVSGDRLKREIPSPKGELILFFGPGNFYRIRPSKGGSTNSREIRGHNVTKKANGSFCVTGGAWIRVTTTGNQPILSCMDTPRGSLTSSRSTPKLVYS